MCFTVCLCFTVVCVEPLPLQFETNNFKKKCPIFVPFYPGSLGLSGSSNSDLYVYVHKL